MKRITAWFDRHTKTRIALQLALDGAPFFMLAFSFIKGFLPKWSWTDDVMNICMTILMYGGGVAIFLLGIWWRKRAEKVFNDYPKCETLSNMLRVLSAIPAFISLGFLVGGIINGFKFHY